MKCDKSIIKQVKESLKKGVPIEIPENDINSIGNDFQLHGVPAWPPEQSDAELRDEKKQMLTLTVAHAGLMAAPWNPPKFKKRDFNSDCSALSDDGKEKVWMLFHLILIDECDQLGIQLPKNAAYRKKKIKIILDEMLILAGSFFAESQNTSPDQTQRNIDIFIRLAAFFSENQNLFLPNAFERFVEDF